MDVGCYCVSGARLLAGEPERVQGEQVIGPSGVDVRFTGHAALPARRRRRVHLLLHARPPGTGGDRQRGIALRRDPWHCRDGLIVVNGREETRRTVENSYKLQLENVSAAIRGEAPLLLGREDALGQARTIEALYAAALA